MGVEHFIVEKRHDWFYKMYLVSLPDGKSLNKGTIKFIRPLTNDKFFYLTFCCRIQHSWIQSKEWLNLLSKNTIIFYPNVIVYYQNLTTLQILYLLFFWKCFQLDMLTLFSATVCWNTSIDQLSIYFIENFSFSICEHSHQLWIFF